MSAPPGLNATVEQAGGVASLKGKIALITGGESGIGQASAVAMARAGATVISTGRSDLGGSLSAKGAGLLKGRAAEQGSETVRQIEEIGGKAGYMKLDVTVEDDWKSVVARIGEKHGGLDILINNAGNVGGGALADMDIDTVWYLVHLNIEGAFLGMTHAWPLLKKSRGVVINMNSGAGLRGAAANFAYPSSKGGMYGLSKGAAVDGRRDGVRVISMHPGLTFTTGLVRARGGTEEDYRKQARDSTVPLKRLAYPADVAVAVAYLASDAARHISGIEFNVDGGSSAR